MFSNLVDQQLVYAICFWSAPSSCGFMDPQTSNLRAREGMVKGTWLGLLMSLRGWSGVYLNQNFPRKRQFGFWIAPINTDQDIDDLSIFPTFKLLLACLRACLRAWLLRLFKEFQKCFLLFYDRLFLNETGCQSLVFALLCAVGCFSQS